MASAGDDDVPLLDSPEAGDSPSPGCRARLRSWVTIEPALFFYFVASISYFPAFQQYIYQEISIANNYVPPENRNCTPATPHADALEDKVQSESSQFMLICTLVGLVPSTVVTLFLGHYSDYQGRKLALIAPIVGGIVRGLLLLIVVYFRWNIYTLLIGIALESCSGGVMMMLMAAFAYTADVSSVASLSIRIFVIELVISFAIAVATISTGYLIRDFGFDYTFLFSMACFVVALVVMVTYVRETVTPRQTSFFTLTHLKQTLRLYVVDDGNGRRCRLLMFLLFIMISVAVDLGAGTVATFFLLGYPICFDSVLLGFYTFANYIVRGVLSFVLLKILHGRVPDSVILIVGFLCGSGSQVLFGFADKRVLVYAVPFVGFAQMLVTPISRSQSSKLVAPQEQGAMFAAVAFGEQLAGFLGGFLFSLIYSKTVFIRSGIVFFFGASLLFLGAAFALILHCRLQRSTCKRRGSNTLAVMAD